MPWLNLRLPQWRHERLANQRLRQRRRGWLSAILNLRYGERIVSRHACIQTVAATPFGTLLDLMSVSDVKIPTTKGSRLLLGRYHPWSGSQSTRQLVRSHSLRVAENQKPLLPDACQLLSEEETAKYFTDNKV